VRCDNAETSFYVVLVSDTPDAAGRGNLLSAWDAWSEPVDSVDKAMVSFTSAAGSASRSVIALAEVAFTDMPFLAYRAARVVRVLAWHGPLGLVPGVLPGEGCWKAMDAAALAATVQHLGLS
jgi:hypothetical protein